MAEKLIQRGKVWYFRYTGADGRRVMKRLSTDKRVAEQLARKIEEEQDRIRGGWIDEKDLAYREHAALPLSGHLDAYAAHLADKGRTEAYIAKTIARAGRVVALSRGARLADVEPANSSADELARAASVLTHRLAPARLVDLTTERVQAALATLRERGRSLATCNHYATAICGFARWCYETHRLREYPLRGIERFNAKEDRRHDRRTISLEELQRLIEVASRGPRFRQMTGPQRVLCYRLAVATGLRFSEIGSIRPSSFDWEAPSVTVRAGYTKNGQEAVMPLTDDLASDLAAYVAQLDPALPIFLLPRRGAEMLRGDLKAAGIPYCDASGLFFDFHSLRCETATLADQAGVSPRVVQKLMRHSSLEMTGRYTRPRAVDIEAAASLLPSLKPAGDRPEPLAMTGTDSSHANPLAPILLQLGDGPGRSGTASDVMAGSDERGLIDTDAPENRVQDGLVLVQTAPDGETPGTEPDPPPTGGAGTTNPRGSGFRKTIRLRASIRRRTSDDHAMASPCDGTTPAARTASRARVRPYAATSPSKSAATASQTASHANAWAARIRQASG
jgi:integrase